MKNNHAKIDLCGQWEFFYVDYKDDKYYTTVNDLKNAGLKSYPCTVPGNFELDLYKNGLCPEPFYGMNPVEVRKMTENCSVYYYRKFDLPKTDGAEPVLIFEGLDCYAEILINGGNIMAQCDNMLFEHELKLPVYLKGLNNTVELSVLKEKDNEILVHIKPAIEMAKYNDYPPSVAAMGANTESLYVRKAPHMYGWDIMPRFLSAGIWRPVYIEYMPNERIDDVFLHTIDANSGNASIKFHCNMKLGNNKDDKYAVGIKMICGDSVVDLCYDIYFGSTNNRFNINNPKLWFPKGSGEQNLYEVCVYLRKNGDIIDEYKFKYGVRTVRLHRTSTTDQFGNGAFEFVINGVKIFMKGSNWVPADAFHSRDKERIPAMLEMAEEINCNMLRCWGGNVYEDDLFYEICDEKGFLIWQDFAFACAVYPQDENFCKRVREEAIAVVKRLRNHACVALWSGDNECDEAYLWNGFGDPNKNKITREVLPEVISTYDGSRPYIPSSPYFDENVIKTGQEYASEKHLWGPRDYYKSPFYINSICHFASEIGYHGCPSVTSIKKFIEPEHLWCDGNIAKDEQWLLHSTSPVPELHLYDYRVQLMINQIAEVFDKSADNLKDFAIASQIVQAEAKKFFIELFRGSKWRRSGILWWNLIDGWPQLSDAVVDYYFDKKLAYYYIKNSQQQLFVMLREPNNWGQEIVIVNDYLSPQTINYKITDIDTSEILISGNNILVGANSNAVAGNIPFVHGQKRFLVIDWETESYTGKNHYLSGHPPFSLEQYLKWIEKSGIFTEWTEKIKAW